MDKESILYGLLLAGFGFLAGWVVKGYMEDRAKQKPTTGDLVSQILAAGAAHRMGLVPWATPRDRDPNYAVGQSGGVLLGLEPEAAWQAKQAREILTYL